MSAQTEIVTHLLKTRIVSPKHGNTVQTLIEVAGTLDDTQAQRWIERLEALQANVPDGRYAIRHHDQIKFYRVVDWKKKPGFKLVWVQAGDEEFPIKNREMKTAILDAIREDVEGASKAYGHEIGACGVCGRTLTNPSSIEAGIGPICAENSGW